MILGGSPVGVAQSGNPISSYDVGQEFKLRIDGEWWDWILVQKGNPDPEMYAGEWDNVAVMLLKNIYLHRAWNSGNNNSYADSYIDKWLNGEYFYELFDSEVKGKISENRIPYCSQGPNPIVYEWEDGWKARVFLLSCYEVGITSSINSFAPTDGAKLQYFANGVSNNANGLRKAEIDGIPESWYLRSPYGNNGMQAFEIQEDGSYLYKSTSVANGTRPAISLPLSTKVNPNLTIT